MSRAGKSRLRANLDLIMAYFSANLSMESEYRGSFITRVFSMLLNDMMWLTFWLFYFERFPAVRGWERADIITLWAVIALGFGLASTIAGNWISLSRTVYNGELDVYLTQPKSVMLQVLVNRSSASAWGDVFFGIAIFAFLGNPTPTHWVLFIYGALLTGLILASFGVIVHSLSFFAGNAENFAGQVTEAMIHYSTYPISLFDGWVKVVLFTLIPAGFISYIPVGLIRSFSWAFFLAVTSAALSLAIGAIWVFHKGLKRYESGNLMQARL